MAYEGPHPIPLASGGTGSTAFTAGSVVFSNGTILTQDNSNFFWDDTNNRLGIGITAPLDTFHVVGAMELDHTASEDDDHAIEIVCDAAGFGDVKALDIDYVTGAIAAGADEEVMLVNIEESASTGGTVAGYQVLATSEGSAVINGYTTGININPILHNSGVFGDADDILNVAVDVTAALASGGAGAISCFVLDNDTMTIGDAAEWNEMEIILSTGASGAGISATFEFSTGGAGFTAFSPADGTNGMRNSGSILWVADDLVGWATNASGLFEIRITRTRNSLSTTPIMDELQISSATEFTWDSSGDLVVNSISLSTVLSVASGGTGATTLTGVLTGNGTSAFTASAVTDNTVVMGSTSNLLQDTTITVTDAGEMVNTSQPAFLAYLPSSDSNASGDGTTYTLGGTTALTELFDQNADFNTNGTFTAPVTGRYTLAASWRIVGATAISSAAYNIVTSNRNYRTDGTGTSVSTSTFKINVSLCDMDAADTATFTVVTTDSGGKIDDIAGFAGTSLRTWCYGYLNF